MAFKSHSTSCLWYILFLQLQETLIVVHAMEKRIAKLKHKLQVGPSSAPKKKLVDTTLRRRLRDGRLESPFSGRANVQWKLDVWCEWNICCRRILFLDLVVSNQLVHRKRFIMAQAVINLRTVSSGKCYNFKLSLRRCFTHLGL